MHEDALDAGSLIRLSCDWWWRLDPELRFARFQSFASSQGSDFPTAIMVGRGIQEFREPGDTGCNRQWGHLERCGSFRHLTLHVTAPDGSARYLSVSGDPISDKLGARIGFQGVGWDITERMLAARRGERLARMHGALMSTGEVIIRSKSVEELCQDVCEAAVRGGNFNATSILFMEPGQPWLKVKGTAGQTGHLMQNVRVSSDESLPEDRGMVGTAFRSNRPSVSNDWLNDPRSAAWRARSWSLDCALLQRCRC